jgi:3alpha(or 20beta)-hydroxysteroid dehydrogenase
MKRLENKVAIITGACQGMGESHARMFVNEGAKVIMTDVNQDLGLKIASTLGENAIFIWHDVTDIEGWKKVIMEGESKFGPINVLVNNAGILGPITNTLELREDDYLKVCAINQHSIYYGMKYTLPSMLKAGIGSIINISSLSGILAIHGFPSLAYMAAKFAVRGMTKAAAVEYGPNNIRVNSVHPGYIKTPMRAVTAIEGGEDAIKMIPLGRLADAKEVSNLVTFLASDESSYLTGSEQIIDGGMSIQ